MGLNFVTRSKALIAGAILCSIAGNAYAAEAEGSLLSVKDQLKVYRVYTGPDQMSHVETMILDAKPYIGSDGQKYEGRVWAEAKATRVLIGSMPNGTKADFHVAIRRTILMPMQGTLVLDVGDGKTYRLKPGEMVLAEDRTGKGHVSGCEAPTGNKTCLVYQLNLPDGESGLQYPMRKTP